MPAKLSAAPPETYALLDQVLGEWAVFRPLLEAEVRIEVQVAFADGNKPGVKLHGTPALAVVRKVGDPEKARDPENCPDVRITLDGRKWNERGPRTRQAILAHELYHVRLATEAGGKIKRDDYDRPVIRLIPDDWHCTGFHEVFEMYGDDSVEARSLATLNELLHGQRVFGFLADPLSVLDDRPGESDDAPASLPLGGPITGRGEGAA